MKVLRQIYVHLFQNTENKAVIIYAVAMPGDIGLFSKMTIEIGWNRSVLEEEVRNRTKFENRRVLVPVLKQGWGLGLGEGDRGEV